MPTEVRLPQLGQTMEEGTIVAYSVKPGDEVKKGDSIFEVETDKATLEVESPADGFVKHIVAPIGQTILVGDVVLILGDEDEEAPQSFIDSVRPVPITPAPAPETEPAASLAEQAETEQTTLPTAEVKLGAIIPLTQKQKITAQKMLRSKREIPAYYLNVNADVTDLVELRTELNKTSDVKISYNDFIMRAVATGLEKFPIMTGQLAGDTIRLADSINIALAIALPDVILAPVISNVNKKHVKQIARDSKALIEKARSNKLTPDDLQSACITVSNLGAFGIDSFIPIVVPGQCSILGVGRIIETCVPENANTIVRKLMSLTLSVDHKIINGAYAGQFLDFVRKLLEYSSGFA
jgi:pyruvate dehydrogenase E2 component (dihydrolipoamide acetyltransferase)